ncbi:MAG: TlpA family protein disulfide reductase [Gammaproteobacteria bacterium]
MSKNLLLTATVLALMLASGWAGFYLQHRQRVATADPLNPPTPASTVKPRLPGDAAPPFSLPDLQGTMRSLSEWRGQVVVLNFWATWCPPCRDEIPVFIALQRQYTDAGLQFVGIALQQPQEVHDFVAEFGINYPILAGELEVIKLAESLGNESGGLPYTVMIDRQGRVQYARAGPLTREQAERLVTALL